MSQEPTLPLPSRGPDDLDISFAELLAPLRRRWKLVVFGTALCWAALLSLYVLAPRFASPRYRGEAVLALPDLVPPPAASTRASSALSSVLVSGAGIGGTLEVALREGPWPPSTRVGVPIGLYRKVERAILDGRAVQALAGKLPPEAAAGIRSGLGGRLSPVASFSRDDSTRLEKDDAVGAVKISYEASSASQARDGVDGVAALLREALVTTVARDLVAWHARGSERQALSLVEKKAELLDVSRSLGTLGLPEARARRAESLQGVRLCEQAIARNALRGGFLRRLEAALDEEGAAVVTDVPELVDSELAAFLREAGDASPEGAALLRAEAAGLRDQLARVRGGTRFDQHPTTARASSWLTGPLLAALASLAAMSFVAVAFVADLWRPSSRPPKGQGDASDSRTA